MLATKNCASSCARLGSVHQRTSSGGAVGIGIEQEPRLTRCWLGLVDLVGIEPTTSPASRGARTSQSFKSINSWWTWSGSNRRPLPCHGSALPAAPQAHVWRDNSSIVAACGGQVNLGDPPGRPGRASGLLLRVDQHLDRAMRFPTL